MGLLGFGLCGCGLAKMLPEHPAITPHMQQMEFGEVQRPAVKYLGAPQAPFPVLPVQVWGLAYDLDLVLVSKNPRYDMHEIASVRAPEGVVWLGKDALAGSLVQSISVDLENPYELFPEIPVARKRSKVSVEGTLNSENVDVRFRYDNIYGDRIEGTYDGVPPTTPLKKRNGSTMGHSRDALMAVLDLSHRNFGRGASISYNGTPAKMKRLLGLVPFRMALQQTQGGLATATIRQEGPWSDVEADPDDLNSSEADFVTYYSLPGETSVHRRWISQARGGDLVAVQRSDYRTLQYRWRQVEDSLELVDCVVHQYDHDSPVTKVIFQPALPDVRRKFEGVIQGRFVIEVNGQPGMAVGRVESFWEESEFVLRLLPESPWWVADRPMETRISYGDEGVDVHIDRISPF